MDERTEEFEHIPWAQLGAEHRAGRNRLLYIAAAAVVALALGAVAARALFAPDTAEPVTIENPVPPAADPVPETPLPSLLSTAVPPSPGVFSEADLMAGMPDDRAAAASARAEWFVEDYFTADLDPLGSLSVRTAIPTNGVPTLPQDGGATGVTYVEWARAYRVELIDPGLYRVAVAFRAVGASGDDPFFRFPVRAVDVVVAVTADGAGMAIVDLPAPARLPVDTAYGPWPEAESEVPEAIATAALDVAGDWGTEPAIVGGGATDLGWRVVVTVGDDVGNRWPLSVWMDATGRLGNPPWRSEG